MNIDKLSFSVKLNTPMDVSDFIEQTSAINNSIDVTAIHNRYEVNGRSLLGLYSLNLSEPITIELTSEKIIDSDIVNRFNKWLVK